MKKYTVLILSIISILAINIGTVAALDYPPHYGDCGVVPYIELSGEDVFFNPYLSTQCELDIWYYTFPHYELMSINVAIEHQRLIGGSWQAGSKNFNFYYSDYDLYDILRAAGGSWEFNETTGWDSVSVLHYFPIDGGVLIENFNTQNDRYRLVVTLEGSEAFAPAGYSHAPTLVSERTDVYSSNWVYGTEAIQVNPDLDDVPGEFADQPNPDDEIPDRPVDPQVNPDLDDVPGEFADQDGTRPEDAILIRPDDRDRDGIPDATDQCPDVAGIVLLQGCPASIDGISNGRHPNLPATGEVCTVETSMRMTFFFDIAPGEPIPLGTTPLAITSVDISDANNADAWETARLSFDGVERDYMVYPAWSSLVRIGGTCSEFGAIDNVTTGS